jgi:hypothetical protein
VAEAPLVLFEGVNLYVWMVWGWDEDIFEGDILA